MNNEDVGLLLSEQNLKLQRQYFKEMCRLRGIKVGFRTPKEPTKDYNLYGELETAYNLPIDVMCIFDEHPTEKTMRKLGWDSQLNDTTTVIHVPYDLEGCQAGAIFILPSGLDNAEPRLFRVLRMSNIAIFPASISCELAPIWENQMSAEQTQDFTKSNFNVLVDNEQVSELEDSGFDLLRTPE